MQIFLNSVERLNSAVYSAPPYRYMHTHCTWVRLDAKLFGLCPSVIQSLIKTF